MKTLTILEVVEKLIGAIRPVGDSNIDAIRFDNLREAASLVEHLLHNINGVAQMIHSEEASVHRSALFASNFLEDIRE